MLKYIIRLDDACPTMNKENWDKIEKILDNYKIRPIVGIIPDCRDEALKKYQVIDDFWSKYVPNWKKKNWIIAQHGLHHNLNERIRTEYAGKDYDYQINNLKKGNKILKTHNISPTCFFAPAHTFDDNTIKACGELNYFKFISDGVSLYPYKYKNMLFLPNIFDTPHKILPFGIYTFVFHPNNMVESDYEYLEEFLKNNNKYFKIDLDVVLKKYKNRKRTIIDYIIKFLIILLRKVKK